MILHGLYFPFTGVWWNGDSLTISFWAAQNHLSGSSKKVKAIIFGCVKADVVHPDTLLTLKMNTIG
ncbi:MAG: hypothetical protein J6D22_03960 [Pyramidobacter sp.]|nr:hypothetical protein [Pyramidobacter sp.]